MPDRSGRSVGDIIKANVFTRINAILGVLFAIVVFTGSLINGLFGLLIIANSGIGIIQEVRAKRTLDKLAIVGQTRPRVRRDGEVTEVPPDEVVLDDQGNRMFVCSDTDYCRQQLAQSSQEAQH